MFFEIIEAVNMPYTHILKEVSPSSYPADILYVPANGDSSFSLSCLALIVYSVCMLVTLISFQFLSDDDHVKIETGHDIRSLIHNSVTSFMRY